MSLEGRQFSRKDLIATLRLLRHPLHKAAAYQRLQEFERKLLFQVLHEYINGKSRELKGLSIRAIMSLDSIQGVDWIIPLLDDPAEPLRWFVCFVLKSFGDTRSVLPLTQVLLQDPDGNIRFMAAAALERTGDYRAIEALRYVAQYDQGTDHEGRRVATMAEQAVIAIQARSPNEGDG